MRKAYWIQLLLDVSDGDVGGPTQPSRRRRSRSSSPYLSASAG